MLQYETKEHNIKERKELRSLFANVLIGLTGFALIAWSVQLLLTKIGSVSSIDAVINSPTLEIKSPKDGIISTLNGETGLPIEQGKVLFEIEDNRVSKLQVQQIANNLANQQSQLLSARSQLNRMLGMLANLETDKDNQQRLEVNEYGDLVEQTNSDLEAARARYKLAQVNYDRTLSLQQSGAFPKSALDTARTELEQRRAEISSLEARQRSLMANREASDLGLTLSKTRSNYDPRLRLEELKLQIENQRQTVAALEKGVDSTEAELKEAKADLEKQQRASITSPVKGVVWKLSARKGQFVRREESLGQLIDCSKRWVDVYVEEQALRSIDIGTPATVELYGAKSRVLEGKVSMIRSGLGRLNAGEDLLSAIPQNLPRNAQVRVELTTDSTDSDNAQNFCYVGYTGKVTLKSNH